MAQHRTHTTAQPYHPFEEIDLREVALQISARLQWIFVAAFLCAIIGGLYALANPSTTASALLRIEPEITSTGEQTSVDTESDIISSWAMVEAAALRMQRNVDVAPEGGLLMSRLGRLVGRVVARFSGKEATCEGTCDPVLRISAMTFPPEIANKSFRVRVLDKNRYVFYSPSGAKLAQGTTGKPLSFEVGNGRKSGKMTLTIREISAPAGMAFTLTPRKPERYVESLRRSLTASRKGAKSTSNSGLIEITFRSQDAAFAVDFLDALLEDYLQKALDRSAVGKIKTLRYLEQQALELRRNMDKAEGELEAFRAEERSIDLPEAGKLLLHQINATENRLTDIRTKQQELGISQTSENPVMAALNQQYAYLESVLEKLEEETARMPEVERRALQLQRDVDIYNRLYKINNDSLMRLKAEAEGITGYARIINAPMVDARSIGAQVFKMVLIGGVIGTLVSFGLVFIASMPIFARVRNVSHIRSSSRIPVVATVPHSKGKGRTPLVLLESKDRALQVIQRAESKLKFITHGAQNNVILFTSDAPGQGKTFLATQLALLSSQHRRTVLVNCNITGDVDPSMQGHPGFSELMIGQVSLADVVVPIPNTMLYYVPPGTESPSFAPLQDFSRISERMEELSEQFDCVVVDYPALEGHDDPQLLSFAGTVLLVIRYGQSIARVKRFLSRFPNGLSKISAIILNDVR